MTLDDVKEDEKLKDGKEEINKKTNDSDVLETVLLHLGQFGCYQKLMFLGMAPGGVLFAFIYFVQMFIAATPQRYWCNVPELNHLNPELSCVLITITDEHSNNILRIMLLFCGWSYALHVVPHLTRVLLRRKLTAPPSDVKGEEWDHCFMYDANWTEVLLYNTTDPTTPITACKHGWEFELKDIPYHTVVSERGWVCDKSGYKPLAQTIFFVGSFFGGLIFGWVADCFGRVPAIIGTNVLAIIGSIATIYTTGMWDFAFCRFMVGTSYDTYFMVLYILVLEYTGPKYRTWVANMTIALFFGSSCLLLPWLAVWISDWRKLMWVTSLPMVMALIVPFTLPESARWLTSRGRVNDAVKVLRRFEKVNGKKIPDDAMDEFIVSASQARRTNQSIKDVFKSAPMRGLLLRLVIVYMACTLTFDGLVRMSEDLGLDFFLTFTVVSATEIPSIMLLAFILDKYGRRMLTAVPLLVLGSIILMALFVPKGLPQVSLATVARFMINMAYTAVVQWSTELMPTPIRASATSFIHVMGYVSTFLSPFIVYSERIWKPLPLLIFGVLALLASGISLMIPETNGHPMPQTIEEGERLIKNFSLFGKVKDVEDISKKKERRN